MDSGITQYSAEETPKDKKKLFVILSSLIVIVLALSGGMLLLSTRQKAKITDKANVSEEAAEKASEEKTDGKNDPERKDSENQTDGDPSVKFNYEDSPENRSVKTANPTAGISEKSSKITGSPKTAKKPASYGTRTKEGAAYTSTGKSDKAEGSRTDSGKETKNDWKTYSNLSFGYELKYPPQWQIVKTNEVLDTQTTAFSHIDKPNEIIASFYIKVAEKADSVVSDYKTKTYITSTGKIYIYQCVHVLEDMVMKTCEEMVQSITFLD